MDIIKYCEERYAEHPMLARADLVRLEVVKRMIGSGKTVLDIGSYDGTNARGIQDRGNRVFGADVVLPKLAQKKINNLIQIPFKPPYPFKDKTFDIVFLGEVLEHIMDTDEVLAEVKRITRDEGSIVITTPNVASLGRRLMLLFGISPYLEVSLNPQMSIPGIGHIRYFTKATLFELLRLNSLQVVEFKSDVVNFTDANLCSKALARLFPTLGRSLIVKCRKNDE
jgi:SAM-dependent methyltransferase